MADRAARQPPGPRVPAPPGHWIVCGYGRFGSEVAKALSDGGFDVTIVDPDEPPSPEFTIVQGLGSDRDSLREAGIAVAEGIVAGSDDDTANLAMAMAARQLRPGIFVILRQNRVRNRSLFEAFGAEMTMVPSEIVANECLAWLRARHLSRFLALVHGRDNDWAAGLTERLEPVVGRREPRLLDRDPRPPRRPGADGRDRAPGRPATLGDLAAATPPTGAGRCRPCRCCCRAAARRSTAPRPRPSCVPATRSCSPAPTGRAGRCARRC